ncbi:unnamed protein product [Aureobasidium pullulans]|nr:unnamed protein product [Aureobasidium pullulans]
MGNPSAKRKRPEGMGYRKPKKLVQSTNTNSNSDFNPVNMDDSEDEEVEDTPAAPVVPVPAPEPVVEKKTAPKPVAPAKSESKARCQSEDDEAEDDDEDEEEEDDDLEGLDALDDEDLDDSDLEDDDEMDLSDNEDGEGRQKKTRKRNDPTAFATSMSKILGTKLTTSKRQDPVLSRSAAATAASKELADQKLELKAKRKMHAEKREALDKGRVKDVLGLNTPEVSTAQIQETEKRLQKTAQRGVVKLFNAVRAAQVQGEQARSEAKKEGVVGISQREERVSEMSKKGFLDLIATGGKKAAAVEA